MAYSDSFPAIRPSFQFSADAGRLDPRISYTRSTTGTFFGTDKHLSSENLLLDSKTGTGNWTALNVGGAVLPTVTSDHAAPPSGGANAATRVQLDLNGGTASGDIAMYYQNRSVASGTSTTFSVWLKSTDGSSTYAAQIIGANGADGDVTVTGAWQKFTLTATGTGANDSYGVRLRGAQTPTNSPTADILIWGANVSTTGETVLNATTTQIHREYAPTLQTAAINAPRFEYSASDSASMGLLIEGSSTNLNPYSDDVSNWAGSTGIISGAQANACVGPNGSMAYAIVEPNIANAHYASININGQDYNAAYTGSVYIKKLASGSGTKQVKLRINGMGGEAYAAFDLDSGAVVQEGGSAFNAATISSVSNGWYRISMTYTNESADRAVGMLLVLSNGDSATLPNYTGDGYTAYGVQNFQVEKSSFPTSPISTSGATATRASDSASMDLTQAGFNGGPVSIVGEFAPVDASVTNDERVFSLSNGSDAENIRAHMTGSRIMVYNRTSSSTAAYGYMSDTLNDGVAVKFGASIDTGSLNGSTSGASSLTATGASLADGATTLKLAESATGTRKLSSYWKSVRIYGEALSDTNLQALTS